jgi:hypothetical protein
MTFTFKLERLDGTPAEPRRSRGRVTTRRPARLPPPGPLLAAEFHLSISRRASLSLIGAS